MFLVPLARPPVQLWHLVEFRLLKPVAQERHCLTRNADERPDGDVALLPGSSGKICPPPFQFACFGWAIRMVEPLGGSCHIPDENRAVRVSRGQGLAVRRKSQAFNGCAIAGSPQEFLARGRIPKLNRPVTACRCQDAAIGREGHFFVAELRA